MGRDKIKSEPIDGFVYEVHQLPATKGFEVGTELIAMIAPIIGAFAGEGKSEAKLENLGDLDIRALGIRATFDVFAEKITSSKLKFLYELMAQHTEIYGEGFGDAGAPMSRNFDEHFAGRYDAMIEWFIFALEVNFRDFFAGLWGRLEGKYPLLQVLPAVLSSLPTTSTGESGESSLQE